MSDLLLRNPNQPPGAALRRVGLALAALALLAALWRPTRGVLIDLIARDSLGQVDRANVILATLHKLYPGEIPLRVDDASELGSDARLWDLFQTGGNGPTAYAAWLEFRGPLSRSGGAHEPIRRIRVIGPDLKRRGALTLPHYAILMHAGDLDGDSFLEVVVMWGIDLGNSQHNLTTVVRLRPTSNEIVGVLLVDCTTGWPAIRPWLYPDVLPAGSEDQFILGVREHSLRARVTFRCTEAPLTQPPFRSRWSRPGGILLTQFNSAPDRVVFWKPDDDPVLFAPEEDLNDLVWRAFEIPADFGTPASQPAPPASGPSTP